MELTMRSWHLLYDFTPESYAKAKTLLERASARRVTLLDDRNEYALWALGISCWGLLKYDEPLAAFERTVWCHS